MCDAAAGGEAVLLIMLPRNCKSTFVALVVHDAEGVVVVFFVLFFVQLLNINVATTFVEINLSLNTANQQFLIYEKFSFCLLLQNQLFIRIWHIFQHF